MRAIVTGGAGFIGSHLVNALVARGDETVVLDNLSSGRHENVDPRATFVEGDVRDPAAVAEAFAGEPVDVCFHLAAQADVRVSVERPDYDCEVNVLGTIRVLEAARAADTRVVLASTGGAIYGECEHPARETAVRQPLSPYGTSKLAAEEYLQTYGRLYGASHVALRFGNVYGPRQDPHGEAGVVAIFLGLLATGGRPRIFGDGRQTRDYVFVGDVVRASLAGSTGGGGVYNVGTGRETSVLDLFDCCRQAAGSEISPEHEAARPGELQRSVLDPELAASRLGFRAQTSLEAGILATWEWVRGKERG